MEPDPTVPFEPFDPSILRVPNLQAVKTLNAPYTTFVELDEASSSPEDEIAPAEQPVSVPFTEDEEEEEDPDLHSHAEWEAVMGKASRQRARKQKIAEAREAAASQSGDAIILADMPICVNEGSRRLIYSLFRAIVGPVGDIHCE